MNCKLVIILPAYNEELTIEKVILDFPQYSPDASVYVIENILMGLIFLLTSYGSILLSIFSIIIFLLVNFNFYIMVNHYSLDIIKIIETSLPEIER